jgi:hypothetical protein
MKGLKMKILNDTDNSSPEWGVKDISSLTEKFTLWTVRFSLNGSDKPSSRAAVSLFKVLKIGRRLDFLLKIGVVQLLYGRMFFKDNFSSAPMKILLLQIFISCRGPRYLREVFSLAGRGRGSEETVRSFTCGIF